MIDGYHYTYDAAGNVATKANETNSAMSETYTYDGLDRLIGMDRGTLSGGSIASPTYSQTWDLDQEGNFSDVSTTIGATTTSQDRTADAANEIASVSGQANPTYDADGNMTFDGTWHYTYDAWNRQVGVYADVATTTDGVTTHTQATSPTATYAYDGNGYRVSKTVYTSGTPVTTDYYYDTNWQVIEEPRPAM